MANLARMRTKALIRRMEQAGDFNYDDEQVELSRRLSAEGYAWKWSRDFYNPHVIVYKLEEEHAGQ